jgi:hypothetical protein
MHRSTRLYGMIELAIGSSPEAPNGSMRYPPPFDFVMYYIPSDGRNTAGSNLPSPS